MAMFNKPGDPRQAQALAQLQVLLGGLGQRPAGQVMAPSLARPPTQKPEMQAMRPILGGTLNG
jgi:hypothetical protein